MDHKRLTDLLFLLYVILTFVILVYLLTPDIEFVEESRMIRTRGTNITISPYTFYYRQNSVFELPVTIETRDGVITYGTITINCIEHTFAVSSQYINDSRLPRGDLQDFLEYYCTHLPSTHTRFYNTRESTKYKNY